MQFYRQVLCPILATVHLIWSSFWTTNHRPASDSIGYASELVMGLRRMQSGHGGAFCRSLMGKHSSNPLQNAAVESHSEQLRVFKLPAAAGRDSGELGIEWCNVRGVAWSGELSKPTTRYLFPLSCWSTAEGGCHVTMQGRCANGGQLKASVATPAVVCQGELQKVLLCLQQHDGWQHRHWQVQPI